MKKSLLHLLITALPAFVIAQTETYTVSFHNNEIKLTVPKELKKMTASMAKSKYPNLTDLPELALSTADGKVNMLGNPVDLSDTEDRLPIIKDQWIVQMKKRNPDLVDLSSGVKKINGKTVAYWKCLSNRVKENAFNYYFFSIVDGNVYLITFNCEQTLQKTWEKNADDMMASLMIK